MSVACAARPRLRREVYKGALTNFNVASRYRLCEESGVASQVQPKPFTAAVIVLPVFDDHRLLIIDWFERIERNSLRRVIPAMTTTCRQLRRVRKSLRHERLAEFLEQTLIALHAGEVEGAKYILLTALATFGWPSDLIEV